MKMSFKILIIFFFVYYQSFSQLDTIIANDSLRISVRVKDDSENKINDVIQPYGWIDYAAEFYTIDSKNSFLEHHFVYQPYLSQKRTVRIEVGFADAYLESGRFFSPTDLAISYQRTIEKKEEHITGYQGIALILKFVIPTGRAEYYSGFDSWILEPQIGTQWKLKNPNWSFSATARYNYSFATLPGKEERFSFLRLEGFFGFENKKWWIFLQSDYRYITNRGDASFLFGGDAGYKVSSRLAIRISGKKRIYGDDFFDSLFTLGGVWYL